MLKSIFIFFILLSQTYSSISQTSYVDSLKGVAAQETNVTEKLKNYFHISNEYYRKQLRYDSSLVYLNKIRTIAHKEGNKEAVLVALNNQALIYDILGDKEKAISYFNKGLHVSKELNMPSRDVLLYNNIGLLYKDLKQYEKSLTYLDSAYAIVKNGESKRLFGVVNTSLGETNYAIGNYKESIHYLKTGVSILDSLQQPSSEADFALAKSYRAEKKIDLAIRQAQKAFREAQEQKAPKSAYESSLLLSSMYAEIGDSEKEAIYLKETLRYNDSLSLRTDLNDIELKELKEQQKVQAQQLQSLKDKDILYTVLYIVGAIILVLLSILIFRQYRNAKLTRDIHSAQRDLIQSELERRGKGTNQN